MTRSTGLLALVVGAGSAGAATVLAALATDPTARVALVDRATFPRDKFCGDGLTPSAVATLGELGVDHVLDGFAPVEQLEVTAPAGGRMCTEVREPAYVVTRREFDARLVNAAVSRGAELITSRVSDLVPDVDRVVIDGRWSAPCRGCRWGQLDCTPKPRAAPPPGCSCRSGPARLHEGPRRARAAGHPLRAGSAVALLRLAVYRRRRACERRGRHLRCHHPAQPAGAGGAAEPPVSRRAGRAGQCRMSEPTGCHCRAHVRC